MCVHMCVCVCVNVWVGVNLCEGVCVLCSVGGRQGGKECVWLVYSWTSKDCVWTGDTWQLLVMWHKPNPAEPISAMEMARESHLFSDIMTHVLFAWGAVVKLFWLMQWHQAWKYHRSVNKGSLWRWGEGVAGYVFVCVCVILWHCDLLLLNSVLGLFLYSAFLDQRSIYLKWLGFRHPDSVVGGL